MKWLTEWCLGGFVLAVIGHITGSMGFYTLGYGMAALVLLRLLVPLRPARPTSGLGFILLAVGGLGGWFGMEDLAAPGSWPLVFKVFAGICLGALVLLLWQFFARQLDCYRLIAVTAYSACSSARRGAECTRRDVSCSMAAASGYCAGGGWI